MGNCPRNRIPYSFDQFAYQNQWDHYSSTSFMCLLISLTQCDIQSEFYSEEVNMQSSMLMYHRNSNSNVSLPGTKFMVKYTLSKLTYPHILLPTVRWGLGLPYGLDAHNLIVQLILFLVKLSQVLPCELKKSFPLSLCWLGKNSS